MAKGEKSSRFYTPGTFIVIALGMDDGTESGATLFSIPIRVTILNQMVLDGAEINHVLCFCCE